MRPTVLSQRLAIAGAFALLPAHAFAASTPAGVWLNDTGRGAVEIKPCGDAYCGHVVWVKSAADTKGCGKQIIGDAQSVGSGHWDNGWIYSPEKKQRYDVELTPMSDGRLRVVGYAGVKLFSKTMYWTRAPQDLVRCGEETIAKAPLEEPKKSQVAANATAKPAAPDSITAGAAAPKPAGQDLPQSAPVPGQTVTAPEPKAPSEPQAPSAVKPVEAQNEPKRAAEPAPASTQSAGSAKVEDNGAYDGDPQDAPKASGGKLRLGDIDLDQVLKRNGDGSCKLDLPWVKVHFHCDR